MDSPFILKETDDYLVVFKPPKMHCTKNKDQITENKEQITLHEWVVLQCPSVFDLMHRLDFETQGLVLFAKNEKSYYFFKTAQDRGEFVKEYSALCSKTKGTSLEGFPESSIKENIFSINSLPFIIESYFRPFGPGRKQVRPIIEDGKKHKEIASDKGDFYQTEIIKIEELPADQYKFTVRIKRGFRHQIRCHLSWAGFPILNDPLYSRSTNEERDFLALRSHALFFPDPSSRKKTEISIDSI